MEYIEITPHFFVEDEDINFVFNKTMTRIHGFLRSSHEKLGIDFPESSQYGLGNLLRVFGDTKAIENLISNSGIQDLNSQKMINIGTIDEPPSDSQKVRTKHARGFGERERLKKARARREFLAQKDPDMKLPSIQHLKAKYKNQEKLPHVIIEKNARKYVIKLKTEIVENDIVLDKDMFNSYGLGSSKSAFVYRF